MILHIEVIQGTPTNIDLNDTMIPIDVINAINKKAHDRLINSAEINHEARAGSEMNHDSL